MTVSDQDRGYITALIKSATAAKSGIEAMQYAQAAQNAAAALHALRSIACVTQH